MRPIFFDQPIESVSFGVACAIWYVPELIGTFLQRAARRNGMRHDRGSYAVLSGMLWGGPPPRVRDRRVPAVGCDSTTCG